jgi:hypothetical protein
MSGLQAIALSSFGVLCCVSAAGGTETVSPLLGLPDQLLVGEPVEAAITLEWVNPREGMVLYSSSTSVAFDLFDDTDNPVPKLDCQEIPYRLGSKPIPADIALSADEPRWQYEFRLDREYSLTRPGTYEIRATWRATSPVAPPEDPQSRETEEIVLSSWKATKRITVSCPSAQEDRDAYRMLAGGECPLTEFSVDSLFFPKNRGEQLVASYPTATYSGYVLARGYGAVPFATCLKPHRGEDNVIVPLASGQFLRDWPEVRLRFGQEPVMTRDALTHHRQLLESFIAAHPTFQYRDKLELILGLNRLAVGDIKAARAHWEWIEGNSSRTTLLMSAEAKLQSLERNGFLGDEKKPREVTGGDDS